MKKLTTISLNNSQGINNLIKSLEKYKVQLAEQAKDFVDKLMDVGINTAKINYGKYKGYIVFKRDVMSEVDGCTEVLIATDGQKILREWYTSVDSEGHPKGEKHSYFISPLLLAEFGSGWLSVVLDDVAGVGQGTMPNNYGHAMDADGWYWYDESGQKHHSIGEAPLFPLHKAVLAMEYEIERVGREVFGNV